MSDDTTTGMLRGRRTADRATAPGPDHGARIGAGDVACAGPEPGSASTVPWRRAAAALELKRGEFELAVQLGHVRTTPAGRTSGRRSVTEAEIARLRRADGFPRLLRDRVHTVGTAEAAGLMSTTSARFTKLARTGHLTPIRFRLNRYRAVVWLYLASELREFAERNPDLLAGKLPPGLRARVDEGDDWRARNWRGRRLGVLLRLADDPWCRAAAIASLLDTVLLAEIVGDPHERACLERLRPEPPYGRTASPIVRAISDRLLLAEDADEVRWHRISLALSLDEARASGPPPRPATDRRRLPDPDRRKLPGARRSAPGRAVPRAADVGPGPGAASGEPGPGTAGGALPRPRSLPDAGTLPHGGSVPEPRIGPEAGASRPSPSGTESGIRIRLGAGAEAGARTGRVTAPANEARPGWRIGPRPDASLPAACRGDGEARHRAPSGPGSRAAGPVAPACRASPSRTG
ncbi:DUF6397 family protein [Streptomyces wuyuanensis]|uniref:Uncharacterized protein n=1 Tax=Streptomyces wuyuanensis TaxID=1196353 RepID=A0A1G9Z1P5_9ACTN|nr:DUF6397 family protein [Streptomyces wuyuanensis]SDN15214.1 hypothetical protein SAMN05444921_12091 [Streptomyces wuyuanensis]